VSTNIAGTEGLIERFVMSLGNGALTTLPEGHEREDVIFLEGCYASLSFEVASNDTPYKLGHTDPPLLRLTSKCPEVGSPEIDLRPFHRMTLAWRQCGGKLPPLRALAY
jgi:hypothetical protein